jgi:arylsulfatase A-like enzyme
VAGRRSDILATTLDVVPTVLDAVKVSYPPDLAGASLLPAARGELRPDRARLQGQNDRNLLAAWDRRFKIVATPLGEEARYALYDRQADPGETRDASAAWTVRAAEERRELERFRERIDAEMTRTRRLLEGRSGEERLSAEACEKLKAMGYVQRGCP